MLNVNLHFFMIIGLAVAASMALCAFWYSPKVFGNTWQKLAGVKNASDKDCRKMMLFTAVAKAAMATTLLMVITWAGGSIVSTKGGIAVGLLMGFGFSCMSLLTSSIWENKPPKLFVITATNQLASLALMGAIIGHLSKLWAGH